jgi:hypothetical protein
MHFVIRLLSIIAIVCTIAIKNSTAQDGTWITQTEHYYNIDWYGDGVDYSATGSGYIVIEIRNPSTQSHEFTIEVDPAGTGATNVQTRTLLASQSLSEIYAIPQFGAWVRVKIDGNPNPWWSMDMGQPEVSDLFVGGSATIVNGNTSLDTIFRSTVATQIPDTEPYLLKHRIINSTVGLNVREIQNADGSRFYKSGGFQQAQGSVSQGSAYWILETNQKVLQEPEVILHSSLVEVTLP